MRQFPDTTETIGVFVDQLPMNSMTPEQIEFASRHYAGTQKLTSSQAALLRAHNPDFIVLHYRLGLRQSDPRVKHIHDDAWGNDWDAIGSSDPHNLWIYTNDRTVPLYRLLGGGAREYVADLSKPYWQDYWAKAVIAEANACNSDGVFADSCHPPTGIPQHLAEDSLLGKPPYTGYDYCAQLDKWFDFVYPKLQAAGLYLIPNVAGFNTGWDKTTGYYSQCDGVFVEGFGITNNDWRMQAERTLRAIGTDNIYIAQCDMDITYAEARMWYLANFLLLKNKHSFVNMRAFDSFHWLPEYDLNIGRAISEPIITDPLGICSREYQRATVLVNPTSSDQPWTIIEDDDCFTDCQRYATLLFSGGGHVGPDGVVPTAAVTAMSCSLKLLLPPWTAAIVVRQCDWDRGEIWKS